MDAADASRKPASHSVPPPLVAIRGRSGRVADLAVTGGAFSGPPDTPPRQSLVSVPYVWEDAPGKPKGASPPTACNAATTPAAADDDDAGHVPDAGGNGDRQDSGGHADPGPLKLPPRLLQRVTSLAAADTRQVRPGPAHADQSGPPPRPLKLPPRLQQVPVPAPPPSFAAGSDYTPSPSPKTVLQGPYSGGAGGGFSGSCKPPKWVRSGGAALKRTPSAGMALLSRTLSKRRASGAVAPASGSGKSKGGGGGDNERDAAGHDAPWCSPASSSSSSSVSASTRFGGDGHFAGRGRHGDAREAASEDEEDCGGSPTTRVRFTRFTRTRSLPSLTTSNLWAYVRKGVKQVTPILHGARSWATARYGH